jgi:hypothetical protein
VLLGQHRLAAECVRFADREIVAILNRQGRRTGTNLPLPVTQVKGLRNAPGSQLLRWPFLDSDTVAVERAATTLQVSTATIHRGARRASFPAHKSPPTRHGGFGSPTRSAGRSSRRSRTAVCRFTAPRRVDRPGDLPRRDGVAGRARPGSTRRACRRRPRTGWRSWCHGQTTARTSPRPTLGSSWR